MDTVWEQSKPEARKTLEKPHRTPPSNARCVGRDLRSYVLAEILKMLPENRPWHEQIVTHVNGSVIDRLFVLDVERHGDRRDKRTVLEILQQIGAEANH